MNFNIAKEIFNVAFWLLRRHMADPLIRYIFLFGGSSAAKTYSLCQQIVLECFQNGNNTLITRKFSSDMEDSIYSDIKGIITQQPKDGGLDLSEYFIIQSKKIICKTNGAYIRFRGMDDSEKIKGISKFKFVVLEEFSQYEEEDFKQTRKRMRGIPGQKVICIWNPIDETMWQKTELIDKNDWLPCSVYPCVDQETGVKDSSIAEHKINELGNAIYMRTNYLDNWYIVGHPNSPGKDITSGGFGFRDQHVIADMEYDKINDYEYYWVYGLGNWGRTDRGGEYYKNFDTKRHLFPSSEIQINEHLPIHISCDENVNPYLSMTVYQASGLSAWQIDEFMMKNPKNTLDGLADEFYSRYAAWTKCPIFLYGDSTSVKEDVKQEKGKNFFKIFAAKLEEKGYHVTIRVPTKNPGAALRAIFINSIFSRFGYEGIGFRISNGCAETIKDLLYLKEAADGTKFKKKVKDKVTGIPHEELGHLSDSLDYFICEYFKIQFRNFERGKKIQPAILVKRTGMKHRSNSY